MNGWTSSSAEHSRLLAQSQRLRVQAIQVRLMSGQAFCSIVETEARWGSHQKAQLKMAKVWRLIVELARHIDEPNHIPSEAVPNLRKDLMALQERAQSIHRKLLASELPPPTAVRSITIDPQGPRCAIAVSDLTKDSGPSTSQPRALHLNPDGSAVSALGRRDFSPAAGRADAHNAP